MYVSLVNKHTFLSLLLKSGLVNNLVPCALLLSGLTEVYRFQL